MLDNYIGIIYNTNIMKHLTVIDTNVILSALKSKVGKSHELVLKIGSGAFDFAISVPLILEYEAVLKKRLDRELYSDSDIEDVVDYLCAAGVKTEIFYLWRPYLKDPFDDHVLEVAIQANARTIVTFNKKDFQEASRLGIKAVNPEEFLKMLEE